MTNMRKITLVLYIHLYLLLMNECMALRGDIFHTYGPTMEIVKSYEN